MFVQSLSCNTGLKSHLFQKGLPDHLSPQSTFPSLTAIALTVFAIYFTKSLFTVIYSFPIVSFVLMLPLQVDCIHSRLDTIYSIFCFWSGLTPVSLWNKNEFVLIQWHKWCSRTQETVLSLCGLRTASSSSFNSDSQILPPQVQNE